MEELYIACTWSYAMRAQYAPEDFKVFEKWVSTYVSNWAACDTLCNHAVAAFLEMHLSYIESLKKWAKSQNRWMRRASAVSLIIPASNGKFLKDIFGIADIFKLSYCHSYHPCLYASGEKRAMTCLSRSISICLSGPYTT